MGAAGIGQIIGQKSKENAAAKANPNQQRFLSQQDTELINNARGRFDTALQDVNQRSIGAADRVGAGLDQIRSGQLDTASQSLISQGVDRQRRLQGARQAALASRFGAGSALSSILGAQGNLKSDLALNNQGFSAFRDQIARQGALQQGEASALGLRNVGAQGFGQGLAAQQRTASLRGGTEGFGGTKDSAFDAISPFAQSKLRSFGAGPGRSGRLS